jgi:hypothetical protein
MPILIYSVLRLGLFVASVGLLWWAGVGSWLAVVLAAFLAWGLSYVLLPGPRDRAAIEIAERVARRAEGHRFSAHAEEDAAIEDAAVHAGAAASEREADPEQHSVGEGEHPGHPEDLGEEPATRAGHHGDAQHGDGG